MIKTLQDLLNDAPVDVELAGECSDGKPPRVRMRQPSNAEWVAKTGGLPLIMRQVSGNPMEPEDAGAKIQAIAEGHEYQRRILALAIFAFEIPDENGRREWVSVQFTDSPDGVGVPIDSLNKRDNFRRLFGALQDDYNNGGPAALVAGDVFRG